VSPAPAAPTLPSRCQADERLLARALERIRSRERGLLANAERLAELYDEHARLSAAFEAHLRTCGAPLCRQCRTMDEAADEAFDAYCRLRGSIEAGA
jgi:hypothetical protein